MTAYPYHAARFFSLVCAILMLADARQSASATDHATSTTSHALVIGVPLSIPLSTDARDVVVGDPALLESIVTSGRILVLTGREQGSTVVTVFNRSGAVLETLAVRVDANLDELNEIIRRDLGLETVSIRSAKQALIVSGTVTSTADAAKVDEVLRAYFDIGDKPNTASASVRIVNTLKITDREQVMLRVVVSEIRRSLLKQLGVDTQGTWKIGDFNLSNAMSFPTSRTPTASLGIGFTNDDGSNTSTLKALERAGYLKTLAEPTLTAISGESAKFTAGGEIPVPTGNICSTNALGLQSCQTNFGYKPIGVTLSFTPMVINAGRISLRISTEVTDIDPDNGSRTSSGNLPAFRSRKMETTVELPSGATLMSAGLIQNQSSTTFDRIPGLGQVPILGQLFQSNDYQNNQSELLISVVPFIAKPLQAIAPGHADADLSIASPRQALIETLNRIYDVKLRAEDARFGFEIK